MFAVLVLLSALVLSTYDQNDINYTDEIEKGNDIPERSHDIKRLLVPISEISSSDILIDISQNATRHIRGYQSFPIQISPKMADFQNPGLRWQIYWELREYPPMTK